MHPFEMTREMIDIESITENEKQVGEYLLRYLSGLAAGSDGKAEAMPVSHERFNVYAEWGAPTVVLSTHMDTVPPFFASYEDEENIYGRGACDAKGIIAAMIAAAEKLIESGTRNFGLLFVVGEERNSAGAEVAARTPHGARYLINGEPTESKIALGSKGILRYEISAKGKMAHSAYPELGDSAIEKLLDALEVVRKLKLPTSPKAGPCTMNIGLIEGGRAPNVIPDDARAHLLFRLVGPAQELRQQITAAAGDKAAAEFKLEIPFMEFTTVPGIETMIAAFTTDIPALTAWGKPLLIGPGSIHVAHTEGEYIEKQQLLEAVDLYAKIACDLLVAASGN